MKKAAKGAADHAKELATLEKIQKFDRSSSSGGITKLGFQNKCEETTKALREAQDGVDKDNLQENLQEASESLRDAVENVNKVCE